MCASSALVLQLFGLFNAIWLSFGWNLPCTVVGLAAVFIVLIENSAPNIGNLSVLILWIWIATATIIQAFAIVCRDSKGRKEDIVN
jgi:hypothetical protein